MKHTIILILSIIAFVNTAQAQVGFDVISLDGSAKVQRVQKKDWDKVSTGITINDNDIIETYFQAKLVLQFGKGNVAILGSNSKALVNIRSQKADDGTENLEVNLTLFAGGCFVKAISGCHISVYTSNAVGETNSGSFSTIVETKTGETGFQSLGGTTKTRNIAQKEGIKLTSGQTTMISAGKEPTAPLYMTVRHVSVLKHFFGDDYIETELGLAGIKPTEERSGSTSLSQSLSRQYSGTTDLGMYKNSFSLNKLFGAILDDREKTHIGHNPIRKKATNLEDKFHLEEKNIISMVNGSTFPIFSMTPTYNTTFFSAGLKLSLASNYTGQLSLFNFSSIAGILDLVDHLTIGPFGDSTFVKLETIRNLTIGDGLVVNNFSAANPYILFNPLGLTGKIRLEDFTATAFVSDLSSFSLGGIYLLLEPTLYHFGAGFFYDAAQTQQPGDSIGYRFVNISHDSTAVLLDSTTDAFIYQLDFGVDLMSQYDLKVVMGAGFAQKFTNMHTDGFVLKAPSLSFYYNNMSIKTGVIMESGRLLYGQFHSFYMSNRSRTFSASQRGRPDTITTQNSILSTHHARGAIEASLGITAYKGTSIEVQIKPTLFERHPLVNDTSAHGGGVDFGLSLCINDSLFAPIQYGSFYLGQTYTGLYPPKSAIPSWGFSTGLDLVSRPLIFGIGLSGSFSFGYLDMNSNNKLDATDAVVEFSIGLRRGIL